MTFYWWSHWFWITLLSNFILFNIEIVQTYPSQESTVEYNSHQQENAKKLVTRLYQTSTITWATDVPTNNGKSSALEKLKLQHVKKETYDKSSTAIPIAQEKEAAAAATATASHDNHNEKEGDHYYDYDYDATEEEKSAKVSLEEVEKDLEKKEKSETSSGENQHEIDVKRSAENLQNKTETDTRDETKLLDASSTTTKVVVEPNNYTNFTDTNNSNSTNKTTTTTTGLKEITTSTTNTSTTSDNIIKTTATQKTTNRSNLTTQLPQVPSTPKIVVKTSSQAGNLDWLNTIAAQITPSHVTTDVTNAESGEPPHKIPYTLENVNKPEDLRREEGEHRTRKSKGLSAEYKVNHYINYSSESKNLLTRSAATTVNEYESEESNISSEALSVQRAYFMDAGAISAICLTVFGICCTVGTVGIVLYRRRFLNKPQALSEPDSSVYIDDSTMRVSDNSDEMYSLDNDSFLNSLEAMTIQNYWTDTVKHTKL